MVQKLLKSKQETPLCLGNISEDFPAVNMKKTGLYRYIHNFSVDYDAIEIIDIHKCLDLVKKCLL